MNNQQKPQPEEETPRCSVCDHELTKHTTDGRFIWICPIHSTRGARHV